MNALHNIELHPLGKSYIWDCPLCEYTQGPTENPGKTLHCDDCGTDWTLTDPPKVDPIEDWSWVGRMTLGKAHINAQVDPEDPTIIHVECSFPLYGDPLAPDEEEPWIAYEANISRERLLTLE